MTAAETPLAELLAQWPTLSGVVRTPEDRFAALPDFPWTPQYETLGGPTGTAIRVACIDEGPRDAPVVLLIHGEPSWGYLYRHMIPPLLARGLRVVVPDLVGMGRSDKPMRQNDYSFARHVLWMRAWLLQRNLRRITLYGQDWGSLIGLRMATAHPDRFERLVVANGGLPIGRDPIPMAFRIWRAYSRWSPWFPVGRIVNLGCVRALTATEQAAYDAPFPSRLHSAGARCFPSLVPIRPDDAEAHANEAAWAVLREWHKPLVTTFSTRDPITRGLDLRFQQQVPGAKGQPHLVVRRASHFLQEDQGPMLGQWLAEQVRPTLSTPAAHRVSPDAGQRR